MQFYIQTKSKLKNSLITSNNFKLTSEVAFGRSLQFLCNREHHSNNPAMILNHLIVQRTAPGMANNAQKSTSYTMKSHNRATRNCLTLLDCIFTCTADLSLPALSCVSAGKPKQCCSHCSHTSVQSSPCDGSPPWKLGTELFC